jgi:hypothetical protein
VDGRADVVYDSRFRGKPHRALLFWHFVGNKILTTPSNTLTDLTLLDARQHDELGYQAVGFMVSTFLCLRNPGTELCFHGATKASGRRMANALHDRAFAWRVSLFWDEPFGRDDRIPARDRIFEVGRCGSGKTAQPILARFMPRFGRPRKLRHELLP